MKRKYTKLILAALFSLASLSAFAQKKTEKTKLEELDEETTSEIATQLANPNTTLGTMNFNFDYINYREICLMREAKIALSWVFNLSFRYH